MQILANTLQQQSTLGHLHLVIGILKDKDIPEMIEAVYSQVTYWYLAPLKSSRTASSEQLAIHLKQRGSGNYIHAESISLAYQMAYKQAQPGDSIVVCGSFYAVAEVLALEQTIGTR